MKTPTFNPEFVSFEQWEKAHPEIERVTEKCDNCNDGIIPCFNCGGDETCGKCDGEGELPTVRGAYAEQLAVDKAMLARYRGSKPVIDEGMWFGEMVEAQATGEAQNELSN